MEWRWDFTFEILPRMLWATLNTLLAAGVGYAIALVVGLVFLLGQRTAYAALNRAVRECVEFIRSTPLLVQLFFVYFVGPQFGIELSAWTSTSRRTRWCQSSVPRAPERRPCSAC